MSGLFHESGGQQAHAICLGRCVEATLDIISSALLHCHQIIHSMLTAKMPLERKEKEKDDPNIKKLDYLFAASVHMHTTS